METIHLADASARQFAIKLEASGAGDTTSSGLSVPDDTFSRDILFSKHVPFCLSAFVSQLHAYAIRGVNLCICIRNFRGTVQAFEV